MDEPIRILNVEDLATDAELAEREIRKVLKSCLFLRVETRDDYLTALETFQPDLIVSDYRMPRFDGLTALKLALEHAPFTPVIILTGAINEDTAVECMKAGAIDYVIKEHIKRLGQAVLHALDQKQLKKERYRAEETLKRSEENAKRLARENAIMAEIGRIISSTLNIDEVYALFSAKVNTLLPYDRIVINLINKDNDTLINRYVGGDPATERDAGDIFPVTRTLTYKVMQDRKGSIVDSQDEKEIAGTYPGLLPEWKAGFRSFLSVPLISGDEVIGGLHLRSKISRCYSENDLKLAESIGNQIAGAIANVQLYAERERAEASLKQSEERAMQLAQENAVMAEIGQIVSSSLNVDEIYEGFAEEVKKLISFDRIVINFIDTEKGTVKNVYIAGEGVHDREIGKIYPLEGSGNAEMARTKSILLIQTEDFADYKDRFPMLVSTFQAGFRSILNVPLFSKGRVIGGLLLRSLKPHAYTERDVRIAERIGSQIAGAVANAQLYAEQIKAQRERTSLEEQLHQAQKMEAIGTLAGGIAHDFNNILSAIMGFAELADLDLAEGTKAKYNLGQSIKASNRAKELVQQILAFSRQGRQERKVIDIKPIIKDGLKLLRASLPTTIEIRQNIEDDFGTIEADPTQVYQVLMNLCTNAAHAMDDKGGVLEVSLNRQNVDGKTDITSQKIDPGSYVRLRVRDTGQGIPPDMLRRIFDPYFTTKEHGKGTGLGLSVVHGIVKSHNGEIVVSSEVGKGSTFDVYFPRIEPARTEREAYQVEPLPLGGYERVLFVDDEKPIVEVGREILEHLGYEVVARTSSIDALDLFRLQSDQFDLVVTDMTMPNMTGDKLAQELLRIRPEIPIVLCTGFSEHMTEEKAKAIGIREYVMKPLVMKDLAKAMRRALTHPKKKKG